MPSDEHERAILKAVALILSENRGYAIAPVSFPGMVPDASFRSKGGRYLIVEVGNTDADKIFRYMAEESVIEIRWYTKVAELVGQWVKRKTGWEVVRPSNPMTERALFDAREELKDAREELARINRVTEEFRKSYTICAGCLSLIRSEESDFARYGSHQIVVCKNCEESLSKDDLMTVRKLWEIYKDREIERMKEAVNHRRFTASEDRA
jgi:hypothetical protein